MQISLDISAILEYIISAKKELQCVKLCGKNNYTQHMVYCLRFSHTIYGVISMTNEFVETRRNSTKERINFLNFLMFLTGVILGCLSIKLLGTVFLLHIDPLKHLDLVSLKAAAPSVFTIFSNGKFLVLLYLLAFLRCGAALIPPLFGAEGAFLGAAFTSVISAMGSRGAVLLGILLIFRLFLVLPYGFLLGTWSVTTSLDFGRRSTAQRQSSAPIFLLTLAILLISTFLECTLARWLGGIYYLKFGV